METFVDEAIGCIRQLFAERTMLSYDFNVRALLALIMISLVCGAVGSLVVVNRMAFFSDALAHGSFAGVALGILLAFFLRLPREQLFHWIVPVMAAFGIAFGAGIFVIRERTAQSNDTIIGVFFAGAIGLGAILMKVGSKVIYFPMDEFLFGSLGQVHSLDLIVLAGLVGLTALFLCFCYNDLVFASFNSSLASSRRIRVRLYQFLFIALLAVIVNVCITAVGALLINGLLIVPAAAAANMCRNMRQLFRWSIGICLTAALLGQWLNWEVKIPLEESASGLHNARLGEGGTIVVLSVVFFFLSMLIGPWIRGRPVADNAWLAAGVDAHGPHGARPAGVASGQPIGIIEQGKQLRHQNEP
jgi:zinc transport system permease protein